MKTYITPNTETIEAIYGSVLCDSLAGQQQQSYPTPGQQGGPQGAPRVF